MQLTRKRIIASAMELIERDGIEAVSMRTLATELGCSVMSLYEHVPSKSALLGGVTDTVLSELEISSVRDGCWAEEIRAQARAFRQIARVHPRCAMLVVSRPAQSASAVRPVEEALSTVRAAGFGRQEAVRVVRTIAAYVMGSLLREVGVAPGLADGDEAERRRRRPQAADFPQVSDLAAELSDRDADADFEFGLDLLVTALTAMHPADVEFANAKG